tara:strand:+ start:1404 stop:2150 length:747 start_codon:yes stop_codon:yes gene_type:complete
MKKLVLLRHGQSQWNLDNKFTGWMDIDLTKKGEMEAKEAGRLLKENNFTFDIVYSSLLKRANRTMKICLQQMELNTIPVKSNWRLNERHYGALQGLNKAETAKKYGDEQVHIWRRSYRTPPPKLDFNDERHPRFNKLYSNLNPNELPLSECLEDTVNRFLPYWEKSIMPDLHADKKLLIVAHGNSLRALVKHLDKISDEKILDLNIPTGAPLIYELDEELNPIRHYYLGDQDEVKKRAADIVEQGKSG